MDKELKLKAREIDPTVRIGKKGLTDQQIEELNLQLDKRKLVKVRLLRSFLEDKDKKQIFRHIAELTDSKLVDSIGLVATYYRSRPRKQDSR